jgi:hypothetical protein
MKFLYRSISAAIIASMLSSSVHAECLDLCPKPCETIGIKTEPVPYGTEEYRTDLGGYGYEQARVTPSLAPSIALGTIFLATIIATALQNAMNHSHSHSHSHSDLHDDCLSDCSN